MAGFQAPASSPACSAMRMAPNVSNGSIVRPHRGAFASRLSVPRSGVGARGGPAAYAAGAAATPGSLSRSSGPAPRLGNPPGGDDSSPLSPSPPRAALAGSPTGPPAG